MALYGPLEIARVLLVRPDVRAIGLDIMGDFETAYPGLKLFIPPDGGYRTTAEQARIYAAGQAEGFRAAPPDGHAYHTQGAALDFQIVGTDQDPYRDVDDPRYQRLGQIIESYGYRAGINFRGGYPDPYHADTDEPWGVVTAKFEDFKKKLLAWRPSSLVSSSSRSSSTSR